MTEAAQNGTGLVWLDDAVLEALSIAPRRRGASLFHLLGVVGLRVGAGDA